MKYRAIAIFLAVTAAIALVRFGLDEELPDQRRLVEYLAVEGSCTAEGAAASGTYHGEIVNWFNETRQQAEIFGSAENWERLADGAALSAPRPEGRPAFGVTFDGLTPDQIRGDAFTLEGLSRQPTARPGAKAIPATCQLTVVERLDHLPPIQDRIGGGQSPEGRPQ